MADTEIGWAVLELMGHRRLAGYVTEQEIAAAAFVRLDVPAEHPGEVEITQFYSPSAVYCITPTTERFARAVARLSGPAPVERWELPAAKPEPILDAEDTAAACHTPGEPCDQCGVGMGPSWLPPDERYAEMLAASDYDPWGRGEDDDG